MRRPVFLRPALRAARTSRKGIQRSPAPPGPHSLLALASESRAVTGRVRENLNPPARGSRPAIRVRPGNQPYWTWLVPEPVTQCLGHPSTAQSRAWQLSLRPGLSESLVRVRPRCSFPACHLVIPRLKPDSPSRCRRCRLRIRGTYQLLSEGPARPGHRLLCINWIWMSAFCGRRSHKLAPFSDTNFQTVVCIFNTPQWWQQ